MALKHEDLSYLQEAANEADPADVKAARQLALEAGAVDGSVTIEIEDESGEVEHIDVKRIGSYSVGQALIDDSNSRVDNWQTPEK